MNSNLKCAWFCNKNINNFWQVLVGREINYLLFRSLTQHLSNRKHHILVLYSYTKLILSKNCIWTLKKLTTKRVYVWYQHTKIKETNDYIHYINIFFNKILAIYWELYLILVSFEISSSANVPCQMLFFGNSHKSLNFFLISLCYKLNLVTG